MSDLIDRQQAIDAINEYMVGKRCDTDGTMMARLINELVIKQLPPAELGTNLAEVGTDVPDINVGELISRQAAIEALDELCDRECEYSKKQRSVMCGACHLGSAFDAIEQLPSARPEIIRCKDCKYAEYIDDVKTLWCTECGQGRTVAPDDFCSYADRREETT